MKSGLHQGDEDQNPISNHETMSFIKVMKTKTRYEIMKSDLHQGNKEQNPSRTYSFLGEMLPIYEVGVFFYFIGIMIY